MPLNPLFRLREIPVSINKAEIRAHLINDPDIRLCLEKACEGRQLPKPHLEPITDQSAQLHIITLAHSPGDTSRNTAIWEFTCEVEAKVIIPRLDGKRIHCSCVICDMGNAYGSSMVIDCNFYGLTSLHSPAAYEVDWEIDIVALSGCMKHPVGAFKQKGGDFMWIRDELPESIPTARIFTYGYDTSWVCDQSNGVIERLGSELIAALQGIRSGPFLTLEKPLVLIGHSIGGNIVKEAIIQMLRLAPNERLAIVKSIAGILFFDTPHIGMNRYTPKHMAEDEGDVQLLQCPSWKSERMVRQSKEFEDLFRVDDCEITCFHATRETPGAHQFSHIDHNNATMLVERNSATAFKPRNNVPIQTVPIERNHMDMVQFDPRDFIYVTHVLPKLQKYRKRGKGEPTLDHFAFLINVVGEARPEFGPKTVLRLRGIPPDCSIDELPSLIRTCFSVPRATSLLLGSMATDPIDSTKLTATLSFSRVPVKLSKKLSRHGSGDEWHFHELRVGRFHNVYLVLDRHFRGLTPLHSCADDRCGTDLIALPGLNGHAFGSFKVKGDRFMWLRDSLPGKLPGVRIFIYGYDNQLVGSRSVQTLKDLGMNLRDTLQKIATPNPTIFLGHSLGGLVAKQAMTAMNQHATILDIKFLRSLQGILFFGTPHLGMDMSNLIPLVGESPIVALLNSLEIGSTELTALAAEFERALLHGRAFVSLFHETQLTPTPTRVKKDDMATEVLSMSGPPAKAVSVQSATHGTGNTHPIHRNHSDLVKFDGPYDVVCRQILGLLKRIAQGDVQTTVRRAAVIQPKRNWQAFLEALFA